MTMWYTYQSLIKFWNYNLWTPLLTQFSSIKVPKKFQQRKSTKNITQQYRQPKHSIKRKNKDINHLWFFKSTCWKPPIINWLIIATLYSFFTTKHLFPITVLHLFLTSALYLLRYLLCCYCKVYITPVLISFHLSYTLQGYKRECIRLWANGWWFPTCILLLEICGGQFFRNVQQHWINQIEPDKISCLSFQHYLLAIFHTREFGSRYYNPYIFYLPINPPPWTSIAQC